MCMEGSTATSAKDWAACLKHNQDTAVKEKSEISLVGSTNKMSCSEINHHPAHQQGQNVQREPSQARPFHHHAMKRIAFVKKQIDGVSRGARADVETEEHTESAIHGRVPCHHVSLLDPETVYRRDGDQRAKQRSLSTIFALFHLQVSL